MLINRSISNSNLKLSNFFLAPVLFWKKKNLKDEKLLFKPLIGQLSSKDSHNVYFSRQGLCIDQGGLISQRSTCLWSSSGALKICTTGVGLHHNFVRKKNKNEEVKCWSST